MSSPDRANPQDGVRTVNKEMCYYCFDVLVAHIEGDAPPPEPGFDNDKFPLFVTWYKGENQELRGCIGNFSPLKLHSGLRQYAITSAMRDTRFRPISKDELPELTCSVSLLTNFEDGENWRDWTIGKHGIRIEYETPSGQSIVATYLPQVMVEQKWNQKQTLRSLLRKGDFKGDIDDRVLDAVKLTRYQSQIATVGWDEYRHHILHSG